MKKYMDSLYEKCGIKLVLKKLVSRIVIEFISINVLMSIDAANKMFAFLDLQISISLGSNSGNL